MGAAVLPSCRSSSSIVQPVCLATSLDAGHIAALLGKQQQPTERLASVLNPSVVRFKDGLPTPPADMTGVAYKIISPSPASANYGGRLDKMARQHSFFKPSAAPFPPINAQPAPKRPVADPAGGFVAVPHADSSQNARSSDHKKREADSIASYLQIPSSINDSRGSLAEFAAQMTCIFWFENTSTLKSIEERSKFTSPLAPESIPTIGFQKWVTTILSTTQVSQNVILLALMFIYRLKKFNPGVSGKKGSEFRLMTIALMLGNKFLDDNTYTNKTWAEVSGISVQEIHVMEVEFLSNVRYNLFVSENEWAQWHVKLGLFAAYFNKSSRLTLDKVPSPTTYPHRLSSPTTMSATAAAATSWPQPSNLSSRLPSPPVSGALYSPSLSADNHKHMAASQHHNELPPMNSRKRPREELHEAAAVKRVAVSSSAAPLLPLIAPPPPPPLPPSYASSMPILPAVPAMTSSALEHSLLPHLPRPSLVPAAPSSLAQSVQTALGSCQLPMSIGRTVGGAYPSSSSWVSAVGTVPVVSLTAGAGAASTPTPTTTTATPPAAVPSEAYGSSYALPKPCELGANNNNNNINNNNNSVVLAAPSATTTLSPSAVQPASSSSSSSYSAAHTPQSHLSPSYLLANRYSPYRPVRTVNTLLIPPPAGSFLSQRSIPFEHMHYQTLGKSVAERKTGLLPYVHHGAWPQNQHQHQLQQLQLQQQRHPQQQQHHPAQQLLHQAHRFAG